MAPPRLRRYALDASPRRPDREKQGGPIQRNGPPTLVLGGGPAGLAAAWRLASAGRPVLLLEAEEQLGGISRTLRFGELRFDLGGHRFFTRYPEVLALWKETLGDELLERPRHSRILYGGKFYAYPLEPLNALSNLGPLEALRCGLSYLRARLPPHRPAESFEDWVSARFGRRLYRIFFETYTRKVWGIPPSRLSADWAAQRIKDLDLGKAALQALKDALGRGRSQRPVTLVDRFWYPRLGAGQLFEALGERARRHGAELLLGRRVLAVERREGGYRVRARGPEGEEVHEGASLLSSIPLTELVEILAPPPPEAVRRAAASLSWRHFLIVLLELEGFPRLPDQWLYVHDARVRTARIQLFRNWSPALVPPGLDAVGLEYFCDPHDALWELPDDALVELAWRELRELGLAKGARLRDGTVGRVPRAYAVYARGYEAALRTIRGYLDGLPGLQPIGRGGRFRYDNSDLAVLTGLRAAENLLGAEHDVWSIGEGTDYLEAGPLPGKP